MREPSAGQLIGGRFRLEARLGRGGMGDVWAATHTVTQRRVALKLLSPRSELLPSARRRLIREARAASAVVHENVVAVHDLFVDPDGPVMVMELLEGETLAELIARDAPLSIEEAAEIFVQIVSAVGAAHACGIVHRDLKPSNIFVLSPPEGLLVKVLDFGVARLWSNDTASGDTTAGQLLGTPLYMAPEQLRGQDDVDHRADVWALGVILYQLLSGRAHVKARQLGEIIEELVTDDVAPLRALAPEAPFDVAIMARRMLERDRERRPDDLRVVAQALAQHTEREVPPFGAANSEPLPEVRAIEEASTEAPVAAPSQAPATRWSAASALLVAALVLGTGWWLWPAPTASTRSSATSPTVLPLVATHQPMAPPPSATSAPSARGRATPEPRRPATPPTTSRSATPAPTPEPPGLIEDARF